MKILSMTITALLVMSLAACGTPPASSSAPTSSSLPEADPVGKVIPSITAANYPAVDGSTANMPMMAQVYSVICDVPLEDAETMISVSTTGPSWKRLASGEVDLLMVYEPSENVRAELVQSGAELQITPVGRDALVFLANADNKVTSLSQQQLVDIYTGKVTDWGDVGGDKGAIAAFQRDEDSGSQTLFKKLLMKDIEPMKAPSELMPAMMGALIDGISEFDGSGGAIGYSVYYYAKEMYTKPNLKLLAVDGVEPTSETIGNGSYPLTNEFFVVIRADEPQDSPARLLHDWILTEDGKQALLDAGYVVIK